MNRRNKARTVSLHPAESPVERNLMTDIHTHILPGLDDGAAEMEDSLELAEMALEGGTRYLIATPHSNQMGRFENFYSSALERSFQRFRRTLEEEDIPLKTYLGMEIYATDDMEEKIRDGALISLNESRYYLVEFGFEDEPEDIFDGLEQILAADGVPVVAHPERYTCVHREPELAYEWLRMGCLTQVNKSSLLGRFGRRAGMASRFLLDNGWITCLASDAHSPSWRTTDMSDAGEFLVQRYGEELMRKLMVENPERILRDRSIERHGRAPQRPGRFY